MVCDAGMLPVGIQTMLETILVDLTTLLLVSTNKCLAEGQGAVLYSIMCDKRAVLYSIMWNKKDILCCIMW